MSRHVPSTSNFQPWYTQRRPPSSLRPKNREAPRCGHACSSKPTLPDASRNAMSRSPRSTTRKGSASGPGNSVESAAGTQYSRRKAPIGVPGPTRVSNSFSSLLSMTTSCVSNHRSAQDERSRPEDVEYGVEEPQEREQPHDRQDDDGPTLSESEAGQQAESDGKAGLDAEQQHEGNNRDEPQSATPGCETPRAFARVVVA